MDNWQWTMNVSTSSMKFRSRGLQFSGSLWRGSSRRVRERKASKFVRIYDQSCRPSAFSLLPGFAHLPHQREALTWKPLPTKIIIYIADSSCIADQWSALRILMVVCANFKQFDKLKFDADNESACRRNGTRPFPTNKLDGLCICRKCIRVMKVQIAP